VGTPAGLGAKNNCRFHEVCEYNFGKASDSQSEVLGGIKAVYPQPIKQKFSRPHFLNEDSRKI
jgi:hypothetical protein